MSDFLLGAVSTFCGYVFYYPHLMMSPYSYIIEQMVKSNVLNGNVELLVQEFANIQLDGPTHHRNLFIDYMVFREELLKTIQLYLSFTNRSFSGLIQYVSHYWNIVNLRVDRKFHVLLSPDIIDKHEQCKLKQANKEKREQIIQLLNQPNWSSHTDIQYVTCILLDATLGTTKWTKKLNDILS